MADDENSSLFSKHTERRKEFQRSINVEQGRRRREDARFVLRKNIREDNLEKRRRQVGEPDKMTSLVAAASNIPNRTLPAIRELYNELMSDDVDSHLAATVEFRKLLSIERKPPIDEVISVGAVPRLVQFLHLNENTPLQFQAAWALTNIASGTSVHTKVVVESGAVPIFVGLLVSPDVDVREQSVWALGNIAGDSPTFRDMVLDLGILPPLLSLCTPQSRMSLLRNATWTLSNLCRGKPQPDFNKVLPCLHTLAILLFVKDRDVLTDACWALSYLSDDAGQSNPKIQAVVQSGAIGRLVQLLSSSSEIASTNIKVPALRCIGNIVTGDDAQTQAVLDAGVLEALAELIHHEKKSIRKEAFWTLSNITAGNSDQISQVVKHPLFQHLVRLLREDYFDIKKEAAWTVSNATSGGSAEQIRTLVRQGVIAPLVDLFSCQDAKTIMVALEGIENILNVGQQDAEQTGMDNVFADFVEEADGVTKLEEIQLHANPEIYKKAVDILTKFFNAEEEGDSTQFTPAVNASGEFSFGAENTAATQNGFNF
eukprot:276983_1